MADVWYPGAVRNPGAAASYQLGRNSMQCVKCHFTVGVDSTGIGLNGYFQFLVSRDGTLQQFAPVDALCYDSGEANATGPGIEVEYLPGVDAEVFTDAARATTSALVKWLADEWGIPLQYHDGNHDVVPGTYAGFLSHKSIIQTQEHQDYWPQSDWDLMVETPTPPTPPEEDQVMAWFRYEHGKQDIQFFVDSAGTLKQNSYGPPDAKGATKRLLVDGSVLAGNKPLSPVEVIEDANGDLLVVTLDPQQAGRRITFVAARGGWVDVNGNPLPPV